MKKTFYGFIAISLLFVSCAGMNNKTFSVKNEDTTERTINIYVNFSEKPQIIDTLSPNEKKVYTVDGGYSVKAADTKYTIITLGTDSNWAIKPVIPYTQTFSILNNLPCDVTLKDYNDDTWSVVISSNRTTQKDAYLYKGEHHNFYVEGSVEENGFTYVQNGTERVYYTIEVTGTQIKIKN